MEYRFFGEGVTFDEPNVIDNIMPEYTEYFIKPLQNIDTDNDLKEIEPITESEIIEEEIELSDGMKEHINQVLDSIDTAFEIKPCLVPAINPEKIPEKKIEVVKTKKSIPILNFFLKDELDDFMYNRNLKLYIVGGIFIFVMMIIAFLWSYQTFAM